MTQKSGLSNYRLGEWFTIIILCSVLGWLNLDPNNALASIAHPEAQSLAPIGLMAGPGPTQVQDRALTLSKAGLRGVIAFTDVDGNLYLYIGETNETIPLTEDAVDMGYTFPRFSPDGRYLTYLAENKSGGDLYLMDLETRVSELVAKQVGYWGNYDWAPDSKSIVFGFSTEKSCQAPDQDSTKGIRQYSLETKEKKEIIPPFNANIPLNKPRFSVDGSWISFQSYPCFSEGFALHTRNMATGEIYNAEIGAESDWSPVENLLALTDYTWGGGNGNLDLSSPDLSQMDVITAPAGLQFGDPHFSPDGDWIALRSFTFTQSMFISEEEMANWQDDLILLSLKDGYQLDVCNSREMYGCGFVSWSPDGNQLIFYTNEQKESRWYVYNITTNEYVEIPPFGLVRYESQGGYLDWVPIEGLTESFRTGATPTPEALPTLTPEQVTEPTSKPAAIMSQEPTQEETLPDQRVSTPWLFYAGLLMVFIVILFLIIWIVRQKKQA